MPSVSKSRNESHDDMELIAINFNVGFSMDCPGSEEVPIIVACVCGGVAVLMLLIVLICASIARRTKSEKLFRLNVKVHCQVTITHSASCINCH